MSAPVKFRDGTAGTIRDAVESDFAAIQAVYARHVLEGTATFEEEPPSVDEMRRRWADVRSHGLPWLIAEAGGTVVGYAYAGLFRARSAYRFTCEDSIYLAPEAQRKGIGSALLDRIIARTEAAGWRQMLAVIGDSDNAGSIRLHGTRGFEPVGTFRDVGLKFGRWLDVVLMQRPLGPGGSTKPRERPA